MAQTVTVQWLQQLMSDICYVWLCCHVDGSHLATSLVWTNEVTFQRSPIISTIGQSFWSFQLFEIRSLMAALRTYVLPHRRLSTWLFNHFCLSSCCQNLPCGDSWDVLPLFHGILVYVITFCTKSSKNQTIMDGTYIPNADSTYSIQK